RNPNPARIHRDDFHAALPRRNDIMSEDQRSGAWIMAPEQKGVAVRQVGRRKFYPERVSEAGVLVPITDVSCRDPVGTSKAVEKARQPALRIGYRSSAPRPFRQRHGARTISFADAIQPPRDVVQRFLPTDSLPSGIGIVLRTRALQRKIEPVGMIHQLRRRLALDTKNAAVGVIGICIEPHHFPVRYDCDGGTVRRAKRTVSPDGM